MRVGWLVLLVIAMAGMPAWAAPRAAVQERAHHFGEKSPRGKAAHTFRLRNDGDEPLVIRDVSASCGCTIADLSHDRIPPGDSAKLTAEVDLSGQSGLLEKRITVKTNAPNGKEIELWLRGRVKPRVEVSPKRVHFGRVGRNAEKSRGITLSGRAGEAVSVKAFHKHGDFFELRRVGSKRAKGPVRFEVALLPPLEEGRSKGKAHIEMADEEVGMLTIPVSAYVAGAVGVSPERLVLSAEEGGVATRHVIVSPGEIEDIEVTGASGPDGVEAAWRKLGETAYRVRFSGLEPTRELAERGLTIDLASERVPKVEVPVRVKGLGEPAAGRSAAGGAEGEGSAE